MRVWVSKAKMNDTKRGRRPQGMSKKTWIIPLTVLLVAGVAQVNLAYTQLSAPTDGTVGERLVLAGQMVTLSTQVVPHHGLWLCTNPYRCSALHERVSNRNM